MQLIHSPYEMMQWSNRAKLEAKRLALVPTMGALHQGHLQLINQAVSHHDEVVVSIFVNPLQFNNKQDYDRYPRNLEQDLRLLEGSGVTAVYAPSEVEMYPEPPVISMDLGKMDEVLEGAFRPGHFKGVSIIVIKLFNQIRPDTAYFGMKDLQQFLIIKKLVRDCSFQIKIEGVNTVRNESGLALSSRNSLLSQTGLKQAERLYGGLCLARNCLKKGHALQEINQLVHEFFKEESELKIEYFSILNGSDLTVPANDQLTMPIAICVAGYIEGVRLIDNLYLQEE